MLDRSTRALADRARQRRSRARRKRGRILLGVEVDENKLVEALIRSHRTTEAEGLDRYRLAEEAAAILDDFIAQPWPID
jgi:hypothetical protein